MKAGVGDFPSSHSHWQIVYYVVRMMCFSAAQTSCAFRSAHILLRKNV